MARRGKDNDYAKSGLLRRQYRIQHVMMMMNSSLLLKAGLNARSGLLTFDCFIRGSVICFPVI